VTPVRTIELDRGHHRLVVLDEFEGEGEHLVEIPLQLAPDVTAAESGLGRLTLSHGFRLTWATQADWTLEIGTGWVSPSYGVRVPATRLLWKRRGPLRSLRVEIEPE
jgi:Heparinase II/III-like protein